MLWMKILKGIWRFREVAYILLILVAVRGWMGASFDSPDVPVDEQPSPTVVVDPDLPEQVVDVAKKADKPKGVVERAFTKEVEPDRVTTSVPDLHNEDVDERGVDTPGDSSLPGPRRLPSERLDIPDWGMAEVAIDGRSLSVSSLNHSTGAASRAEYTLDKPHPKLTVRSGNVPHSVREGRNLRGPLRLGIRATGFGGVEYNTGNPAVGAILEGPVGVKLGLGRLAPAAVVGFGEGAKLGGTYTVEWGDI